MTSQANLFAGLLRSLWASPTKGPRLDVGREPTVKSIFPTHVTILAEHP